MIYILLVLAEVSDNTSRELAAQALLSMDSPSTESKSMLHSLVPNANTSISTQAKPSEYYYKQIHTHHLLLIEILHC